MVQKCFCTSDRALDPTFQMKYSPSRFVCNLMEILIIKQIPLFFETPCKNLSKVKNKSIYQNKDHKTQKLDKCLSVHDSLDQWPNPLLLTCKNEWTLTLSYLSHDTIHIVLWTLHYTHNKPQLIRNLFNHNFENLSNLNSRNLSNIYQKSIDTEKYYKSLRNKKSLRCP